MTRRTWAAFAAMAVLWGVPYLFIRVAVGEVSPVFVAWSRLALAAVILLPVAARFGVLGSTRGKLPLLVLFAAFYFALAFTLLPLAERTLPSSLTAIVIAGVPIVVTLISLRTERPSVERIAGLAIGFGGVAVLVGLDLGVGPAQLFALGCLALVVVCYAVGPLLVRGPLASVHPLALSATSTAFAAALLTPGAILQLPRQVPAPGVLISLLCLGVLCTALALVIWFFLIQEAGPVRATVVPYANTLVAVIAGAAVLRESIGAGAIIGMTLLCLVNALQ